MLCFEWKDPRVKSIAGLLLGLALLVGCTGTPRQTAPSSPPPSTASARASITPLADLRIQVEDADEAVRVAEKNFLKECPQGKLPPQGDPVMCSKLGYAPGSPRDVLASVVNNCTTLMNQYNDAAEAGAIAHELIEPGETDNRKAGGKITCGAS